MSACSYNVSKQIADPETAEVDPEADADNGENFRNNYRPEYFTDQQY